MLVCACGLLCRHAVLRQDEAAGQVLGLLLGLDAVKVLLPVEPVPVQAPAPDGRGHAQRTLRHPFQSMLSGCAGGAALSHAAGNLSQQEWNL